MWLGRPATSALPGAAEPRPGWREPLCLFVAVGMDAGARKSSVFSALTRPVAEFEREQAAGALPGIRLLCFNSPPAIGSSYSPQSAYRHGRSYVIGLLCFSFLGLRNGRVQRCSSPNTNHASPRTLPQETSAVLS